MTNELTTTNQRLATIDPFEASLDALLVVVFPKSSSKNYPFAVTIAQGAQQYSMMEMNGKPMHVAVFAKNQADAGRAQAVLGYIGGWKGTLFFSRGQMVQSGYRIAEVISCFLNSCACRDTQAYCFSVIDDPFVEVVQDMSMSFSISFDEPKPKSEVEIDLYAFPCKLLRYRFQFQKNHPSTPQDQIQASGVQHGCNICPNFNPDAFVKVGSRTVLKDDLD
ncbi:MAG TPA: hypothetical protein VNU94_06050 [Acidobacteriaceae bacterium]|nr:hypothetical protein [Acidobacteriaceae bacterium]